MIAAGRTGDGTAEVTAGVIAEVFAGVIADVGPVGTTIPRAIGVTQVAAPVEASG